jgi:hypothetical protein
MDLNAYLPLILQGLGGAILGPLISGLVRGSQFGVVGRVLAVILGAVGVGHLSAAGLDGGAVAALAGLVGGGDAGMVVSNVAAGGVGGGVVSLLASLLMRKRR